MNKIIKLNVCDYKNNVRNILYISESQALKNIAYGEKKQKKNTGYVFDENGAIQYVQQEQGDGILYVYFW